MLHLHITRMQTACLDRPVEHMHSPSTYESQSPDLLCNIMVIGLIMPDGASLPSGSDAALMSSWIRS